MKLHKYKNYAAYKKAQVKANKDKLVLSWVKAPVVDLICERVLAANPSPTFGLCHGTRRGEEQRMFIDRLKCPVLGTEISPTASEFPHTIEWDFHAVKPEWIGACDFIYSNSLDHAKNPARALSAWVSCLKPDGLLVIEWVDKLGKGRSKRATATDPFAATTSEVCDLIRDAGAEPVDLIPIHNPELKVTIIFARRRS
jgi:SAM-dependent methyltransferase